MKSIKQAIRRKLCPKRERRSRGRPRELSVEHSKVSCRLEPRHLGVIDRWCEREGCSDQSDALRGLLEFLEGEGL